MTRYGNCSYGKDMFSPLRDENANDGKNVRESDIGLQILKDFTDAKIKKKENTKTVKTKNKPKNLTSPTKDNSSHEAKQARESDIGLQDLKDFTRVRFVLYSCKINHLNRLYFRIKKMKKTEKKESRKTSKPNEKVKSNLAVTLRSKAGSSKESTDGKNESKQSHITTRKKNSQAKKSLEEEVLEEPTFETSSKVKKTGKRISSLPSLSCLIEEPNEQCTPMSVNAEHAESSSKDSAVNRRVNSEVNAMNELQLPGVSTGISSCSDFDEYETADESTQTFTDKETQTDAESIQKIQFSIIEKLVKDTVSFEFDSIRQMMYMQQLSLMRYMDRVFRTTQPDSTSCDILMSAIDNLMEENHKLNERIIKPDSSSCDILMSTIDDLLEENFKLNEVIAKTHF